ncbi:unnamed protein product [Dicrocoelium dendriticum]|nr:unnamed protein product [Dicrocoelium dendriticum]
MNMCSSSAGLYEAKDRSDGSTEDSLQSSTQTLMHSRGILRRLLGAMTDPVRRAEELRHRVAREEEHSDFSDDDYTVLGSGASSNDNRRELKSQLRRSAEEDVVHYNGDSAPLPIPCVRQQEQLGKREYHPLRLDGPLLPSTNSAFTPCDLKRRQMNSPSTPQTEPSSGLDAEQFDVPSQQTSISVVHGTCSHLPKPTQSQHIRLDPICVESHATTILIKAEVDSSICMRWVHCYHCSLGGSS